MRILTITLLEELKSIAEQHIQYANNLLLKPENELNFRMADNSWSTLECLEHLNRYGNFYIPEISHRVSSSKTSPKIDFKPGILGNYFAKMMLSREKPGKMKTPKAMNPIHSQLNKKVVHEFILQQQQLLDLLEKASYINIEKTKTAVSISKLITLKLGDTLRFVTYHNARHIAQAEKVLKNI